MINIIGTREWIMSRIASSDSASGDVYQLRLGIWQKIGNVSASGATAANGSVWFNGTGAPGVIAGQADGNYYYDAASGDVYQLLGAWAKIGNVQKSGATAANGSVWFNGTGAPGIIADQADGNYYLSTAPYLKKVGKYAGQVDVALMTGETRPLEATMAPSVLVSFGEIAEPIVRGWLKKISKAGYVWDMFCIGKSVGAHADDQAEEKAITIFQTILHPTFEGVHYDATSFTADDGTVYSLPSCEFSLVTQRLAITLPGTAAYHVQYLMFS